MSNRLFLRMKELFVSFAFVLQTFVSSASGNITTAWQNARFSHTQALPKTLIIPTLQIHAPIEYVGTTMEGAMDVPQDIWHVAWYTHGPRPGEIGNAVIDGHLDAKDGPAVFYTLINLSLGDKIFITDENGGKLTFIVTDKHDYPYNAFPINKVFGKTDKKQLQLITCSGTFDRTHENYSDRIVITAEFIE